MTSYAVACSAGDLEGPGTLWVTLQKHSSFTWCARQSRAHHAKKSNCEGGCAAPAPPPRKSCQHDILPTTADLISFVCLCESRSFRRRDGTIRPSSFVL